MKIAILVTFLTPLVLAGCKKDEETISGNWQIENYKVLGVDSLPQIGTLHLEGTLSLYIADQKNSFFDNFQLRTTQGDTTYLFHGAWLRDESSFTLTPTFYMKSVYQNYFYIFNQLTTNQNQPYPVLFPLAGRWLIKKQGKNYLELQNEARPEVELHLGKR